MNANFFDGFGPAPVPSPMHLSTVDSAPRHHRQPSDVLSTNDIPGTQPRRLHGRVSDYAISDPLLTLPAESQPRVIHGYCARDTDSHLSAIDAPHQLHGRYANNRRSSQLFCRDIEGAQPRAKGFNTLREVDPLTPDYGLPPPPEPKPVERPFIRDHISVEDIEGTRTRPIYPPKSELRDPLRLNDIDGAKGRHVMMAEFMSRRTPVERILELSDIVTRDPARARAHTRALAGSETDPQTPVYRHLDGELDRLESSATRPAPGTSRRTARLLARGVRSEPVETLLAGPDSELVSQPPCERRFRAQRVTNDLTDISGAHPPATKTKSLPGGRHSDPLEPDYTTRDQNPLPAEREYSFPRAAPVAPPAAAPDVAALTHGGPWRSPVPKRRPGVEPLVNTRTSRITDVLPGPRPDEIAENARRWGIGRAEEGFFLERPHAIGNTDVRASTDPCAPDNVVAAKNKRLLDRSINWSDTTPAQPQLASSLRRGNTAPTLVPVTIPGVAAARAASRAAAAAAADAAAVASLPSFD